jgi:hypothetical protein
MHGAIAAAAAASIAAVAAAATHEHHHHRMNTTTLKKLQKLADQCLQRASTAKQSKDGRGRQI